MFHGDDHGIILSKSCCRHFDLLAMLQLHCEQWEPRVRAPVGKHWPSLSSQLSLARLPPLRSLHATLSHSISLSRPPFFADHFPGQPFSLVLPPVSRAMILSPIDHRGAPRAHGLQWSSLRASHGLCRIPVLVFHFQFHWPPSSAPFVLSGNTCSSSPKKEKGWPDETRDDEIRGKPVLVR